MLVKHKGILHDISKDKVEKLLKEDYSVGEVAQRFGVDKNTIARIINIKYARRYFTKKSNKSMDRHWPWS